MLLLYTEVGGTTAAMQNWYVGLKHAYIINIVNIAKT